MADSPTPKEQRKMPPFEEVHSLLGKRLLWRSCGEVAGHDSPAVYFIRQIDHKTAFRRWMAEDASGFLYIGTTGKGGMRARSSQIRGGIHHAVKRLHILVRVCPGMNGQLPTCVYCYIPFGSQEEAELWESYFLFSYNRFFGETPPLNRRLQYALLRTFGLGSSDSVLPWPDVSARLLA